MYACVGAIGADHWLFQTVTGLPVATTVPLESFSTTETDGNGEFET